MRQVGHPVMVEAAPVLTGAGAALFFPPPKVRRDEIRTQEPDAATHAFSEAHWCAPKALVGSGRGGTSSSASAAPT